MKTKSIFRKPRVIITALVLAVLVALTAVVVIMAQEKAEFAGVRVTTSGKLNMEFYYNIKDSEAGITKARVEISDGGLDPQEEYVDLVSVDEDTVVATVRLDAAEMGYDVVVTPVTNNGEGEDACAPQEWSMRRYAELVLANEANEEYFAPLKAILNYGSFAKEYFANVQEYPFNPEVEDIKDGIFTRLSNPISAIASKIPAASAYSATSSNEELIPQDSLELTMVLNDTIELRLYYAYNGDSDAHTGAANYDESKGKYFVKVGLIDTEHFTSDYGVKLGVKVNGQTVVSVQNATVLNFIANLAAQEETKDLAGAMYYYYYWTNDESVATIDQATCKHTAIHWEAIDVTDAESASYATCTLCGFKTSIAVPNSVNYFSAPGQYKNVNNTTHTLVNDEDGIYTHINLGGSPQFVFDGTTGKGGIAADEPIFGGAGNYIVFRMRTGNTMHMCLRLNSDHSSVSTNGNSYSMGQYDTGNFGLNWRNSDGTTVAMDTWYTYVIDLSKFANVLYPWADKLEAAGDTEGVQHIGAGMFFHGASAGAYIDVQYFAIVDDWSEVEELVGSGETITYTNWKNGSIDKTRYSNGWCFNDDEHVVAERDVSSVARDDYKCCDVTVETYCSYCNKVLGEKVVTRDHSLKLTKNGNVASYTCTVCNDTFDSYYDGTSADYFVTAGGYATDDTWQSYTSGVITMDSDNMIYQRFRCDGSKDGDLNATNTHHGGVDLLNGVYHKYTNVDGLSDYLVIKLKTTGIANIDFVIGVNGADVNVCQNSRNWKYENKWNVFVIDLKAMAEAGRIKGYTSGTEVTQFTARIIPCVESANLRHNTFDIAYAALVTGWDNVEQLVGEGEEIVYTQWPAGTDAVLESDGTCVGDCVLSNDKIVVEGNTIKYMCLNTNCTNQVVKSITRPAVGEGEGEINFYSAAGQQWNNWHTTDTKGGTDNGSGATTAGTLMTEGDTFFNRIYVRESGGFKFFTGNTSAVVHGFNGQSGLETIYGGSGKFAVMKIRTSGKTIYFGCTNGSTASFDGSLMTGFNRFADTYKTDGDWSVIVIDLTKFNAGTRYAFDENLGAAGFGMRVGGDSTGTHYIDVQYFAVCDNWAEVETVVGNGEDVYYTRWTDQGGDVKRTLKGICYHDMVATNSEGGYTYVCSYCGQSATVSVPSNVNYFSAPGQVISQHNLKSQVVDLDGNLPYTRITLNESGSVKFHNGTAVSGMANAGDPISGGSGNLVVMKIRFGGVDLTQIKIGLYDGAKEIPLYPGYTFLNTDLLFDSNLRSVTQAMVDSDWITYVVDISSLVQDWYTPGNADTKTISAGLKIANGACKTQPGYFDLAYFAIVDDWNEVEGLVGEGEKVVYSPKFTDASQDTMRYSDGSCYENAHTPVLATPVTESTVTTYTYTCSACGEVIETRSVDVSAADGGLNYYVAPHNTIINNLWNTGGVGNAKKGLGNVYYDPIGKTTYSHIVLWDGGSFEIVNYADAAASTASIPTRDSNLVGGTGNYMVLKMRLGSTEDYFRILACDGTDEAADSGTKNGFLDRHETEAAVTDKYTDWVVLVIDLSQFSKFYTVGSDAEKATFCFKGDNNGKTVDVDTDYVDIAYMAICDDWSEVQTVVGTESVYHVTKWAVSNGSTDGDTDVYMTATDIQERVDAEKAN